jgi:hypothetical protein
LRNNGICLSGDLNFIICRQCIWGSVTKENHLDFFYEEVGEGWKVGLVDIEHRKVVPTWRNMRMGEDRVEK